MLAGGPSASRAHAGADKLRDDARRRHVEKRRGMAASASAEPLGVFFHSNRPLRNGTRGLVGVAGWRPLSPAGQQRRS